MDTSMILQYFAQYGGIAIFIIVLLEYMNLPGFPAGIIMPLAGVWAAKGNIGFVGAFFITVLAGLTGSIVLYFLGRISGEWFLSWYYRKFPQQKPMLEEKIRYLEEKGCKGIVISKMIPMVRTLISIPAGFIRMNFVKYCISSAIGIMLWNLCFVGAGYLFSEIFF